MHRIPGNLDAGGILDSQNQMPTYGNFVLFNA